jgi:formylglycine-generating enzyme required for sulfatase activity
MVRIPEGSYRPLYARPTDAPARVASFRIDRTEVTRGAFLAFVTTHPEWRRSAVSPAHADRGAYLAGWRGDLDAGDASDLRRPVTGISWFAAKAFCAVQGKRLPTVAEWEYVAAASATSRDASRDPAFVQRLLTSYATRPRPLPPADEGASNAYGVRGLHGLAWEWVADFDGGHASHDSHASHGKEARDRDLFCASAAIGAADATNYPAFLRAALRAGLTGRSSLETLGFRCAA